eukprot:scaffold139756_cov44-Prasinocladus_malaysianus.AAC.1
MRRVGCWVGLNKQGRMVQKGGTAHDHFPSSLWTIWRELTSPFTWGSIMLKGGYVNGQFDV